EESSDPRCCFFFSSRRRHTRSKRDWSSDVCSSDLRAPASADARGRAWRASRRRGRTGSASRARTGRRRPPNRRAPVLHRERRTRSEEHTSELQSRFDLVCRLLLEKKKKKFNKTD